MRFALIPVKELSQAKARLAPLLSADGRAELALAIFRDLLEAALVCRVLDGVAVVTTDETAAAVARKAGAEVMPEPGDLNEALTLAAQKLRERGVDRLLVLAADLPLATAAAIERVTLTNAEAALVPSPDGGTNALALAPGAFAFAFGPDSARLHIEAAQRAGLNVETVDAPELELDVDTPEDLVRLREATKAGTPVGRRTSAALSLLNIVA